MESKNFFDFDVSLPDHDDNFYDDGGDEYDELNDETFGSAAVAADWEEDHEMLATLTNNEKLLKTQGTAPQKVPVYSNKFDDLKFDALSIKRQIREGTPTMGTDSFYGEKGFSPLRDSIWSSPPNAFPSKFLQDDQSKPESSFSKGMPTVLDNQRTMKTVSDIENELRSLQTASLQLNSLPNNVHNLSRTQPIPMTNHPNHPLRMPVHRRNIIPPNQLNRNPPGMGQPPMGHQFKPGYPLPNNLPFWNNHYAPRAFPSRMVDPQFPGFNRPNFRSERHPFEHNQHFNRPNVNNGGYDNRGHMMDDATAKKNRQMDAEWDEWHRKRLLDPYSGLMNPRERDWLRNIQIMQLHTNYPFRDDFYCTMLRLKKAKKLDQGVIKLDGLQMIPKSAKDEKEYAPPPMENSLGKLQVLSVHAPRKIIDLEVVHLDPSCPTTPLQKEMRRNRQALLYIEQMCNSFLTFEDLQRKIRGLPDCPTRDSYRTQSIQLIKGLWDKFSVSNPSFFIQLLSIRKGKSLLARLMPWLNQEQISELLMMVIMQIPVLLKKDAPDRTLSLLWPTFDTFLSSATYEEYLILGTKVTPHLMAPETCVLECSLFWSIVLRLLAGPEEFVQELVVQDSWQKFLQSIIETIATATLDCLVALTLPSASLKASSEHLRNHLERCSQADPVLKERALELFSSLVTVLKDRPSPT